MSDLSEYTKSHRESVKNRKLVEPLKLQIEQLQSELKKAKYEGDVAQAAYECLFNESQAKVIEKLEAELDKMKWIPAEEGLPKTSKRVGVLFETKLNKRWFCVAEYVAPRTILAEDFLSEECSPEFADSDYEEEKDVYWTPSGWYEACYESEINVFLSEKVTHWKPIYLPDQPEESKE